MHHSVTETKMKDHIFRTYWHMVEALLAIFYYSKRQVYYSKRVLPYGRCFEIYYGK